MVIFTTTTTMAAADDAPTAPTSPGFFIAPESSQSSMFLNVVDSGSIGFTIPSFDSENSGTFITWSCSDDAAATFFGLEESHRGGAPHDEQPGQLGYPTDEDMLMDAAWMQPAPTQPDDDDDYALHPPLVPPSSSPPDNYRFEENDHFRDVSLEDRTRGFLQELQEDPDSPQLSPDGSLTSHELTPGEDSDEGVEIRHEPPPLNMKRLEKEEPTDDGVEAAEVTVELIENRRPWRCGLEGCNKTFKNPQTMKMHHKTHYTDGSALDKDGVATLPTLEPTSCKPPHNKKIPSRCPKCRKTFVGLYELRRHYGRKHSEGEKPFACRKCDKKFYIEVDVRDHEKLCGDPTQCKCGLKFAFKCNLVAHKKAHPACQEINQPQQPTANSHSPAYSSWHNYQSTSTSDEDSSQSRENSMSPPIQQRPRATTKRRHHSLSHESSPTKSQPPSKHTRYYTLTPPTPPSPPPPPPPPPPPTAQQEPQNPGEVTGSHPPAPPTQFYTPTPPAPEFKGQPKVDYASSTFKAAFYDFAGIQFSTQGTSLWTHNLHYPGTNKLTNLPSSHLPLPSTTYTSMFGALQPPPRSQFRHQIPQVHTHDSATRLQLTDRGSNLPVWCSIPGDGLRF